MEVRFAGSYNKYKVVQNSERLNEIDLHNVVTGHIKPFLRVVNRHSTYLALSTNGYIGTHKQNKKIKSLMMRKWNEFNKPENVLSLGIDEATTEFLLYVSKSIRDFKLEDLLEE